MTPEPGGGVLLLKRLELQGFKSFAERVVLEFGPGISGIVGPNGAGKSNIADAVRWALGEQNPRLLRCSRMEDLIFSGSTTRRPLSLAEAVLVLDNEDGRLPVDFTEVSLTRRLYRSGESEYLLNGSSVRLRDITGLLAGTGLGREGYSLVGQGRIEELLMVPPEGRRGLFDEACGIGVHRTRKREALGRLEDAAGRLERVSDIIAELEAQLAPLDRQAAVARSFVAYREELERLELWLDAESAGRLRSRAAAARARLAETLQQAGVLRERRARLEEEVRTLRTAFGELDQFLEQRRRRSEETEAARRDLEARVRELESLIAEREREIAFVREEASRLAARSGEIAERLAELESVKTERLQALSEAGSELALVEEQISRLGEELGGLRTLVEERKAELIEVASRAAATRSEVSSAEAEETRLRAEAVRVVREREAASEEMDRLAAELAALSGELEETEAQALRCSTALKEAQEKETALDAGLRELGRGFDRERERVGELEVRQASLEAAAEAEDSWSRAALAAAAAAGGPGGGGLLGVLGENLEADPEDRTAVEAALGRRASALVVRTARDLRHYVDHFKAEGLGPAVIIPVDLVAEQLRRRRSQEGFPPGSLAERVSCPTPLRPVVEFLLGETVLVGSLEEAVEAVSSGAARRAVTRDGCLACPGGVVSLTGRRGPETSVRGGTLNRMRELRAVRDELDRRREALRALAERRRAEEEALAGLRAERNRLSARQQEFAILRTTLAEQIEARRAREEFARRRAETLAREGPGIDERLLAAQARAAQGRELLRELARREAELREEVSRAQVEAASREEAVGSLRRRTEKLRVDRATLEERVRAAEAESLRLAAEEARLAAEAAGCEERLARLARERQEAISELDPLRRRVAEVPAGAGAAGGGEDQDWSRRRQELTADLEARERELAAVRDSLEGLAERTRREEARLARLEAEEDILTRRLVRDYGEDWESRAASERPDDGTLTEEAAGARVTELRRAMADLGVVNIGAIEEHRRLTERIEFLKGQARDLEEAREGLLRLIREMDETMSRKFEEGFLAVRRAFREQVPRLFGGGRGELVLTDPDNLLDSGIEILVEPPSKRMQSLTLLSAGERALSALALVFSFLEVRPCPCVLLDEIDAPLDEANVARFAATLTSLAERGETQFIIVTHNKATMEISEALYGVTMGEDGVSRLVSVKLRDGDDPVPAAEEG